MNEIKKVIKNNEKELYLGVVISIYVAMYLLIFDIIDKYFQESDFWIILGFKFLFLLMILLGSLFIISDLEKKDK